MIYGVRRLCMRLWPKLAPAVLAVVCAAAACSVDLAASATVPDMAHVVVRYHDVGPGGQEAERLAVTTGGRACTLRRGERVVLQLRRAELRRLRQNLAGDLADHQGTVDRTQGTTDEPFAVISAVDLGGDIHHVRFEGRPRESWFDSAADRLGALTARVRREGEVDARAPIQVAIREDPNRSTAARRVSWPSRLSVPEIPDASTAYQTYSGAEGARLRRVLGVADRDVDVRLPDGRTLTARWSAVLPGI